MTEQPVQHDTIPESSAARLAFYTAFIPLAGFLFYMALGFLALIQIGRGQTGFHRLNRGLIAVLILSVVPIVGLVLWAELPLDYYVILNEYTTHGRIDVTLNPNGQPTQSKFFRFGKLFMKVRYAYYENGMIRSEAHYRDDKIHGTFTYWYNNGNKRLIETFANNRRHGRTSWFDMNGKLEGSMNYVDGISQEQIDAAKQAGVEPVIEVDLGGGVKMRMIFIPPGEFLMGNTEEEVAKLNKRYFTEAYKEELPQHKIVFKEGFYLGETEITLEQWVRIMKNRADRYINGSGESFRDIGNHPIGYVSLNFIQEYIKLLNSAKNRGVRLPSEAEWEYACRAGATTYFGFGDDDNELGDYAWYDENSGYATHPVGSKKQNNWGLYDMHGNVFEWCEDGWHENYLQAPDDGTAWVGKTGTTFHVVRGGSFRSKACRLRTVDRQQYNGDDSFVGFRLAKSIGN